MGLKWRHLLYLSPITGQALWIYDQYNKYKQKNYAGPGPTFSSQYGRAVPVLYGRPKLDGGVLVYLRRISSTNSPAVVVLGEGTTGTVTYGWKGNEQFDPDDSPYSTLLDFYDGTQTSGVITGDNARNLPYKRSALAVSQPLPKLDFAVPLTHMGFEVQGFFDASADTHGNAEPELVVADMLTNTRYGLGWDSSRVTTSEWGDSTTLATRQAASYAQYMADFNGTYASLSRACTERMPLRDYLEEILDATHSTVTWQFNTAGTATLYFVPRGDTAGVNYAPWLTVRYALDGDDLLKGEGGESLDVEYESRGEVDNTVSVSFVERFPTDQWGIHTPSTVEVEDPLDVSRFGLKRGMTMDLPCITRRQQATVVAKLAVKHALYKTRGRFTFRLGWRFLRLDPLDYVSITDTGLGITGLVVQIESIEEDEDGVLTVTAIPADLGTAQAVEHATQSSDGDHLPNNPTRMGKIASAYFTVNNTSTVGSTTYENCTASVVTSSTPDVIRLTFSSTLPDTDYDVEMLYARVVNLIPPPLNLGALAFRAVAATKTTTYVDIELWDASGDVGTIAGPSTSAVWSFGFKVIGNAR